MDSSFDTFLKEYDYSVPTDLIAQQPAEPRDSAKLLVYNKVLDKVAISTFANITPYLPKKSVLVFNQTKVIPARLHVFRKTGGKVEIFYIKTVGEHIEVMANRPLKLNEVLTLDSKHFTVVKQQEKYFHLKPSFPIEQLVSVLHAYGETPIPPYIKDSPLTEDELRQKYQTVFAKKEGSVAAPTASLHFTDELLEKIKQAGHDVVFVTLHVNLGTFAPLTDDQVATQKLHEEWCDISQGTAVVLNQAKAEGRHIIAVGTTVVRTLESAAKGPELHAGSQTTSLFISEGYQFRFISGMITNFHVPKSSLLMLVAAFVGRQKLFELYHFAIQKHFKFFSFGDGMLLY